MKVLVIGSGGREHALVWKLAQSPHIWKLFCAPGNGGIAQQAQCIPLKAMDFEGLLKFAQEEGIDLTVVGPEAPLIAGIVNRFSQAGLRIIGPPAEAARLEGSKAFARDLARKKGIPHPQYRVFTDFESAKRYLEAHPGPVVVKADGEAFGKGSIVCDTTEQAIESARDMLVNKVFGPSGERILIEERMQGEEFSAMALVQGNIAYLMPASQDHKRIYEGDQGPNTGGMGAYSPVPFVTPEVDRQVMDRIVHPVLNALMEQGIEYRGFLYPGLMMTEAGPKVVEFNCRLGDPEAQAVLPRMQSDLLEVLWAIAEGRLEEVPEIRWSAQACACVVVASKGYPGSYETGKLITGLEEASSLPGVLLFHAGTRQEEGRYYTSGGRVLGVTALGDSLQQALDRAYQALQCLHFEGMYYRRDIGWRALSHLS